MATKEQIEIAIAVINEVAGSPDSGAIADLVKSISKFKDSDKPANKEVRVVEAKEIR